MFGPEWARDTGCCAKPAGCTNPGPACLMRGHPWKRRHAMATSRRNWPVMFRAGRSGSEYPAYTLQGGGQMADQPGVVLLADISEFQPDVNDAMYLAWSRAVIIRAAYGAFHDDRAWRGGLRRDLLHSGGVKFLGIYQYVVAGQDTAAQAREFCRLIGAPRAGEYYIADIEEGAGNLRAVWNTWTTEVVSNLGAVPLGSYSGRFFARDHGLAPVDWIASYGTAEPPEPHLLWQFSDSFQVPGVGRCDCSVFHGSIDQLAAHAYGGKPATSWTETLVNSLPALQQGNRDHPGTVQFVHRLQALVRVVGDINHLPGASAVKADGNFGQETWTGLLQVQKFFGLAEDGITGKLTWTALIAGQRP